MKLISKWLIVLGLLFFSSAALAQLRLDTRTMGPSYQGVGQGSTLAERDATFFRAIGDYRSNNGVFSIPAGTIITIVYSDGSTEKAEMTSLTSYVIIPGTFTPPPTGSGGGGAGYYYWGGSVWIFFGHSNCIGCIYYGEVGPVTPAPKTREL